MKTGITKFILICAAAFCLAAACNLKKPQAENTGSFKGIVINEIAAHDETADAHSWVEIYNGSDRDIDISGLGLYIWDEYFNGRNLWSAAPGAILKKGERIVVTTEDGGLNTGISSAAEFTLTLSTADGQEVDSFTRSTSLTRPANTYARGSYQRIPDGGNDWKNLSYNSKGRENKIFQLDDYNRVGVWVWSSHISSLMANNAANLKNLKKLGYDHIILNFAAFHPTNKKSTIAFLEEAEKLNIVVHGWIQCFYNNGAWISPVDDENKCYKEEIFANIRNNAKSYLEEYGIKGLHLDYIRFGGTAYKHNPTPEVTAAGAVTRCCREIREITDSFDEGLVTSAALMPEEDGIYYYGQDYNQMGKYIHILMPMIYKYSYNYSDATCVKRANMFASNTGGAECWAGTTTYQGNDSKVVPMDAAGILKDCEVYKESKAKGIVLFRYALGTFPDMTTFWNN